MKKALSVFLMVIMLLSLAACGNSGEIKKYIETAQTYLDAEDFDSARKVIEGALLANPDNEKLLDMMDTVDAAEKAAVPEEGAILGKFSEYMTLCEKWFFHPDVNTSRNAYKTVSVDEWDGSEAEAYVVIGEAAETKEALDALFAEYCTDDAYSELRRPHGIYLDVDGKLCVAYELGGQEFDSVIYPETAEVTKKSNTRFFVSYLKIQYEDGFAFVYECSVDYSRCDDGVFRFGPENALEIENSMEYDDFVLTGPVEIMKWPSDDADVSTALGSGRYEVSCGATYSGWAYVCCEEFAGWVQESDLHSADTEEGAEGDSGEGSGEGSGDGSGSSLSDIVDAGVDFIGGLVDGIFG